MKYTDLWDKYSKDISCKRYNIKKTKFKEYILEIYKENIINKNNEIHGLLWK